MHRELGSDVMLVVSGLVQASLPRVWAWWTDFGNVGDALIVDHGAARSRRFIVGREGAWLLLEERTLSGRRGILLIRHRVRIDETRHEIHEETTFPVRSDSVWRFREAGPATRVTRTLARDRWGDKLLPAGIARRGAQRDLDAHVAEANAELGNLL